jgi:UDP-glucuronate 4-epimerase
MKSVLVTGCAGFIGSHLTDALLKRDYKVIGIDNFDSFYSREIKKDNLKSALANPRFLFHEIDITEADQLNSIEEPVDIVVHLAAKAGVLPSKKNPEAYIKANVVGTGILLEFMQSRGIRKYIFASSSSIYGNTRTIPFKETDNVNFPISPYAVTKRSCELLNHVYHYLHGIDTLNLRLFTVYGPRQRPDLAIHKFVNRINYGAEITMYGDGSTSRDYTYIADTVDGIVRALDYIETHENVYEIINIGNNHPVKLSDLISTISNLLDKDARIVKLPMQDGDVDITYADINKAKTLLNYNPATSLETGIKKFIDWYNEIALRVES